MAFRPYAVINQNEMKSKGVNDRYVAFLRGINVGGHHKVPMAKLREELAKLNFKKVVTLLNSGNVIFESGNNDLNDLENTISTHLEKTFGFPIPTIIRRSEMIINMTEKDPFKNEALTKDIRWYVSFLKNDIKIDLQLPWESDDGSFRIINLDGRTVISVLDLSISGTPKGMEAFERFFGKDATTRNWKTIKRIQMKLEV